MKLTKEEIVAIADRLDEIIGDHFHDAIWDTLSERENDDDIEKLQITHPCTSDEDIQRIKDELKRIL